MTAKQFEVQYLGDKYDIKEFLRNHPGGKNYVENFKNKDIKSRMYNTDHSKAAFYLLREYKLGGRNEEPDKDTEDLESLVDWSKPMLSQVPSLGSKYHEWVSLPVDRELRLFEWTFLEVLTITPWYLVPIIWIPVIFYLLYLGSIKYMTITNDEMPILPVISNIVLGVFMWTLIEYSLHRWVFHMEPSGKSKTAIVVHFTLHGLHHKVPFDTRRLVFPPFPAAIISYVLYKMLEMIMPESIVILVTAGGILGYVLYDLTHFYLHNGSPAEGSYMYNMKRYHNQHHFVHNDSGFGISNKLWDNIFGTLIKLKELSYGIKW